MATKIASLYAEISGDTSKLDKSLANTKTGLTGFGGKLNDVIKQMTGFSLGSLSVTGALVGIGKFLIDTTKETQAYNLSIVDLARKMGTSTEETSKLVQVGDDLRLSQEQISTAMNFAIRNGVEPSIAGLSELADKYNSLDGPVAKGQLLLKTFGRSGMEMGKLLEQGSAGIKSMADNIESGLIVTEQAAAASKKYYAAVDKLTDAWNAFKYTVGNAVIPVLTDLIDGQGTVEDQLKAQANTLQNTGGIWGNYGKSAAQVKTELAGVNGQLSNMQWGQAYAQLTLATGGQQGFADVTQTTTEEIISEVSALKDLTPQFLFNKAAANLDADAAMTLATNMGLVDKKAVVANKVLDTLSAMQGTAAGTGVDYALAVERLYKNIDKLQDKSIDVIVNIITRGRVPVQGSGWGGMPGVEDTPRPPDPYSGHHATGINTVVPAGFNDNYPMFFKSGEKVKATPAGQTDNDMAMVISKLDKLPSAIAKAVRDGVLMAAGGAA